MFASTLDGMKCGYLADPVFAEIAARFEEMRGRAQGLGLSLEAVRAAEAREVAQLTADFTAEIERGLLAITDPLALELERLAEVGETRLRNAEALGLAEAEIARVQRLNAAERERALAQDRAGLEALRDEIAFGALSGASAAERLSGTRGAFQAAAAQALSGDAAARGNLAGLARSLLDASREVFASGAGFQADRTSVLRTVETLLGVQGAGGISNDANAVVSTIQQTSGDTARVLGDLLAETAAMRREIASLRAENERLRPQIERLLSRNAA